VNKSKNINAHESLSDWLMYFATKSDILRAPIWKLLF